MNSRYHEVYEGWQRDPEAFWAGAAGEIDWFSPWEAVFDPDQDVYGRWFAGATCNTCYNCIDRHVEGGRADQTALIYDSPITGAKKSFTYAQLKQEVEALAAVIRGQGIGKGDRVIIYMPMVPEAAFAMLACARLGAIHSVVFGGFAAKELATRIDDAGPTDHFRVRGIEPGRGGAYNRRCGAISMARGKGRASSCSEQQGCDLVDGRDITTAMRLRPPRPRYWWNAWSRQLIRSTCSTRPARQDSRRAWCATMAYGRAQMVDVERVRRQPGEVFWAASDVGWVVGYLISSTRCCMAARLCCSRASRSARLMPGRSGGAEHGVVAQPTAPTAFRAIRAGSQGEPSASTIFRHS